MDDILKESCEQVVAKTLEELKANPGWERQYAEYGAGILINLDFIRKACDAIMERLREPLTLHLTTGDAMGSWYEISFDMCYLGQKVARLTYDGSNTTITTKKFDEANKNYFDCELELSDHGWDSEEYKRFKKYFEEHFKNNANINTIQGDKRLRPQKELRLQSQLISEIAGTDSNIKHPKLVGIQPVLLANKARFMMKIPISASDPKNIHFGKNKAGEKTGIGGNIDLLTRVGIGAANALCVVEVKREYGGHKKALQQGVAYATFLIKLLHSSSGKDWWKIFGYEGEMPLPEKINPYVAIAMPLQKDKKDKTVKIDKNKANTSFGRKIIKVGEKGNEITLHYIYFDYDEPQNKIKEVYTSLTKVKPDK